MTKTTIKGKYITVTYQITYRYSEHHSFRWLSSL